MLITRTFKHLSGVRDWQVLSHFFLTRPTGSRYIIVIIPISQMRKQKHNDNQCKGSWRASSSEPEGLAVHYIMKFFTLSRGSRLKQERFCRNGLEAVGGETWKVPTLVLRCRHLRWLLLWVSEVLMGKLGLPKDGEGEGLFEGKILEVVSFSWAKY